MIVYLHLIRVSFYPCQKICFRLVQVRIEQVFSKVDILVDAAYNKSYTK